jgi:hypothetical protein
MEPFSNGPVPLAATTQPFPCRRCGMALQADSTRCPRCGRPALPRFREGASPTQAAGSKSPTASVAQGSKNRTVAPSATLLMQLGAALPRRLTAADPNGARRWGLSPGTAAILFGFAIAFGAFVAITEREQAADAWDGAHVSRYAGPGAGATDPYTKQDTNRETSGSPPASTPALPYSEPMIAVLQQQIDSARQDGADNAERLNRMNAGATQRGPATSGAVRSSPMTASHAPDPERRIARAPKSSATNQPTASLSLPPKIAQAQTTKSDAPTKRASEKGEGARTLSAPSVGMHDRSSAIAPTPSVVPPTVSLPTLSIAPSAVSTHTAPAVPASASTQSSAPRPNPAPTAVSEATARARASRPASLSTSAGEPPRTSSVVHEASPTPKPAVAPHDSAAAVSVQTPKPHGAPTHCTGESASACEKVTPVSDSKTQTHTYDAGPPRTARTAQKASTAQNKVAVAPRASTKRESANARPVQRHASVKPKSERHHPNHRPLGETAKRAPGTGTPLLSDLRRPWRFNMPQDTPRVELRQKQLDIYRN